MLQLSINELAINRSPALKELIDIIKNISEMLNLGESVVYHNFPLYPKEEGVSNYKPDIMLISKNYGIYLFKCLEANDSIEDAYLDIDRTENIIFARILKDSTYLVKPKRKLKVSMQSLIFIRTHSTISFDKDISIVINEKQVYDVIVEQYKEQPSNLEDIEFNDLLATIEGAKAIQRQTARTDETDAKTIKGFIYDRVEREISSFDYEQKRFALIISDGPQRIRGLAGSGKTIILAMKVAHLHIAYPNAKILYTYYTKALGDIVEKLISRFHRNITDREPNWDNIDILHAWGGKYLGGVYYNTCVENNLMPLNFESALTYNRKDPFAAICEKLITNKLAIRYDYSFLDEGQDFPSSFYKLCRMLTKDNNIVWAYDDFQNILDTKIQDEKSTFGIDNNEKFYIDFSANPNSLQDIILHKCYRNPRKTLIAAFSLGLGIYNYNAKSNDFRIVQRLEDNKHWESLGFNVELGDSSPGSSMIISRPLNNSFEAKNKYLDDHMEIIKFRGFATIEDECLYVKDQIMQDLSEKLKPEDISVICLDDSHSKKYFQYLSYLLIGSGVGVFNLQEAPSTNTLFKKDGYVTLSTVYKAKGNESASVYIIGTDSVFVDKDDVQERNKLFTAITRAQAWVVITGTGELMQICVTEYLKLVENDFKLKFIQPTSEQVVTIMQGTTERQKALNKILKMADEIGMDTKTLIDALTTKSNQLSK